MTYRYYISFNSGGAYSEVFPSEIPKLTVKKTSGSDFRLVYVTECSEINLSKRLNSTVYETFKTDFKDVTKFSTAIYFKIYRGDISTGTLIFSGRFSVTDIRINYELCNVIFTPIEYVTKLNWADVNGQTKIDCNVINDATYIAWAEDIYYPTPLTASWVNSTYETFTETSGVIAAVNTAGWGYAYVPMSAPVLTDGIVHIRVTGYSKTSGETPSLNLYNNVGAACGVAVSVANGLITIIATATATRVGLLNTANSNYGVTIEVLEPVRICWDTVGRFGIHLANFLEIINPAGNIYSTFLFCDPVYGDAPASIDTYMGLNPTHNYVTEAENELINLFITSANIFNAITSAQGDFTFAQFMTDLANTFNVRWYSPTDNNMRIEHVFWFEEKYGSGISLLDAEYIKYKAEADQMIYEIDKSLLAWREEWKFPLATNEDFVGLPIIMDDYATNKVVSDYNISTIITDGEALRVNTDDMSGFFLMQTVQSGTDYFVDMEQGVLSGVQMQNGHLSLANLHDKYWRYGRPCITGTMNGAAETFESSIAFYKSSANFATVSDIDNYGYVTTSFGDGLIDDYERDLMSDFISVNISFRTS